MSCDIIVISVPCTFYCFVHYYDQQVHNYFTNYHTATCFDTFVSHDNAEKCRSEIISVIIVYLLVIVKVKESRNRLGVAQRVPGGSQIFMTFDT